jgi:hypothetical protein
LCGGQRTGQCATGEARSRLGNGTAYVSMSARAG